MKETFVEYNFFIKEKEERFFQNATIVLDSETLLTLYYYPDENRRDFFKILEDVKINNRLYLPHQIGFEFYQERERAMVGGKKLPKEFLEEYEKGFKKLKSISSLDNNKFSLFIKGRKKDTDTFNKKIEKLETEIIKQIKKMEIIEGLDEVLESLVKIFDNKVGKENEIEKRELKIKEIEEKLERFESYIKAMQKSLEVLS